MAYPKMNNPEVAAAWSRGDKAQNRNNNYRTDGLNLYSYAQVIGFTTKEGKKILLDYTARSGHFLSQTTSGKHIAPARRHAHAIMNPSVIENTEIPNSILPF